MDFDIDGREVNWPDEWSDEERVEVYVGSVIDSVELEDVTEACGLEEQRARELIDELVAEDAALVSTDDDVWEWDEAELRRQERERFAGMDEEELREELERIEDEIDKWRDEFDAEEPDDVVDRKVAYDWQHDRHTRELILSVLGDWEYEVREETGDESDPRALDVIDRIVEQAQQTQPPELVDEEVSELVDEHGEEAVRQCA